MGLSPKNTPRTPSYLLPFVTALATFSITALFLYKVYLSPSLFYISLLHFIKQLLYNIYIYIICWLIFSLGNLIEQVDNFVSQTKTVAGHNLDPTPWHPFRPKSFDEETRQTRAYKIIHCSYLACHSDTNTVPERRRSNSSQPSEKCPEFFRWIHQDLEPWARSGISKAHLEEAQKFAAFRVVIVGGKLYVDWYYACVQSRAMFTIWGLLQLLKRYPGMVPDVDMMFECMDKPRIYRAEHQSMPLPLFRYCTTKDHYDIPFPDWSFWGW